MKWPESCDDEAGAPMILLLLVLIVVGVAVFVWRALA